MDASISDLTELKPRDRIWTTSEQFGTTNPAIFTAHDRTGLKRAIGYARFDRGLEEPEFAIWQDDLDSGRMIITRR
jgi:hypothetical protein